MRDDGVAHGAYRLARHEAHRNLGESLARDNGLGARSRIPRMNAVHLDRRLERIALDDALALLAANSFASDIGLVGFPGVRTGLGRSDLFARRAFDAVQKSVDRDRSVGIVKRGNQFGNGLSRIGGDAAVGT